MSLAEQRRQKSEARIAVGSELVELHLRSDKRAIYMRSGRNCRLAAEPIPRKQ